MSEAEARARLRSLADAHAKGTLDATAYEAARREAERALSDAVLAADSVPSPARPSRRLFALLACVVLVIAIGGYAFTGSPTLATADKSPPPAAPVSTGSADGDREMGLKQIAQMVDGLAERLKTRPDDAEGWAMLARSYAVLTRFAEAVPAYEHASRLQPKNAGLMADWADAVAASNGGQQNAASLALIERALAIDPTQPKALALAGTVAFERGDYAAAVRHWQVIADALPADGDFHRQVVANIDEAKRRGGIAVTAPKAQASATMAAETLTGTVTLAPSLAARAAPDDTVFVLARPDGGRMPLAVFRATVKDLPIAFRLDDGMAMTPAMKISGAPRIVVVARVSKSGNAISQPGDLVGESAVVAPGARGLAIEIARPVP